MRICKHLEGDRKTKGRHRKKTKHQLETGNLSHRLNPQKYHKIISF